ncbi:MAG TPA: hypothetical protein ACFE0H_01125 [Elainellaceae cyanobacterium]
MDELTPLLKELTGHPIAFLGGFFSGAFRLNLNEDPVKVWLDQQAGSSYSSTSSDSANGRGNGPQPISIE